MYSGKKCGIVGLPNVGKSTLFNFVMKEEVAEVANYPFCTIDPNIKKPEVKAPKIITNSTPIVISQTNVNPVNVSLSSVNSNGKTSNINDSNHSVLTMCLPPTTLNEQFSLFTELIFSANNLI